MKILVINTVPFIRDGTSSVIMDNYRALKDRVSFDFVVNTEIVEEFKGEMLRAKSNIYFIKNRKKNPINYFFALRKILKKADYDVIHIHGNSSLLSLELLSIKEKQKIITHGHNVSTDYPILNIILKPYFKRNFGVGVVPTMEAGRFLFEDKSFHIIPNGIELSKYAFDLEARKKVRKSLGINNEKIIICVGNLTEQKYQELLITILPQLLKKVECIVLLVGEGKKRGELMELVNEKKVARNVKFLGSVSDVQNYYSAADVFVLPTYFESFGLVAIEAEVNGLPCIVSDCVPRIVKQAEDFYFVANSDLDLWVDLILQERRKGAARDLRMFSIEKISEELLKVYQEVSSKQRRLK